LEIFDMKLPLMGAIAAITLAAASTTFAAESNSADTVSGASDSTVMSQSQDTKAVKKLQKQKQADEAKRGRPANQQTR
jgi:hypothetical protein